MSEDKLSQSLNISGGQLSNVNIGGQAGQDLTVHQHIEQSEADQSLTPDDVAALMSQLEDLFRSSSLPDSQKEKALQQITVAKTEVQAKEPDKDYALKSFQRATKVLTEAEATVEATTGLWDKVEAIATKLAPWFGVAAKGLLWF